MGCMFTQTCISLLNAYVYVTVRETVVIAKKYIYNDNDYMYIMYQKPNINIYLMLCSIICFYLQLKCKESNSMCVLTSQLFKKDYKCFLVARNEVSLK